MYIEPLISDSIPDIETVGAKALHLSRMCRNSFPVPEGFIVTAKAFRDFCIHNGLSEKIRSDSYAELSSAIINGKFPEVIINRIRDSLSGFKCSEFAVRSSSAAEDGTNYSMAGQYDTFLCIPPDDVFLKIKECWAGMFNGSVIAYCENNNLPLNINMGVIVQKQIRPLFAGVMFTLDPLTKSTDRLVVEWVEGMGDRLVSGEANPERIYVSRIGAFSSTGSAVPDKLSDVIPQLISAGLKAEKLFNNPVDIEWCTDESGFHILQCRPITGIKADDLLIWTNVNMAENFPDVLTPFTWSITDMFYIYYAKNLLRLFGWSEKELFESRSTVNNLTGIHGGRIYYNLSNWYEGAHFLPIGSTLKKLIDSFLGQNIPFDFKPHTLKRRVVKSWQKPLRYFKFLVYFFKMYITADFHINRYQKNFYITRKKWRSDPYRKASAENLIHTLDDIFLNFIDRYYYNPAIVDILAALFPGSLKILTAKWLSDYSGNSELLSARLMRCDNLRSTEPSEIIRIMAFGISKQKNLQDLLESGKYSELEKNLTDDLNALLDKFMSDFGGRCYNDCTIVTPTFEEQHNLFWDLVEKYQRTDTPDPEKRKHTEAEGGSSEKILKRLPLLRRIVFYFIIKNSHRAIRLREKSRLVRSLLFGEIRSIAIALGHRLVTKGFLHDHEDIFYLQKREIDDIVNGKFQFPELIGKMIDDRKKAVTMNSLHSVPDFFIRPRSKYYENMGEVRASRNHDKFNLHGVPTSGGSAKGIARIVLDPVKDNRLQPGEILVAKTTDPGWTPLFKIAGGLILEKGGILSHAAIVAREFGIPAIVGIEDAVSVIRDGSIIYMNGDTGEIRLKDQE